MFLHVMDVTYLKEYHLEIGFNNGVVKEVDLHNELEGAVFEPLKEIRFFQQVRVNPETNTIEWPNGADFAPEFLYELGQEIDEKQAALSLQAA